MEEMKETLLLNLSHEALLHICSFLDYRDLLSLCQTCKILKEVADDNSFWRQMCKYYWLEDSCPDDKTWKEHFASLYDEYGQYISTYRNIRAAWNKIEKFTKEKCPLIYRSLNGGLSESQLKSIENRLKCDLPNDLKCSYRIHNGQEVDHYHDRISAGLMGTKTNHIQLFQFGDYFSSDHSFNLVDSCDQYKLYRDLNGFLALTICMASYDSQFIAINSDSGMDIGTVVHPVVGTIPPGVTAELDTCHDCFIMASSYTEWLCGHAEKLETGLYPVVDDHIYRFLKDPSCSWTTNNITVNVSTCFMPEFSSVSESSFCHSYFVSMHMKDDAPQDEVWQLETRHWELEDADGSMETVDGPGVVGEYPIMKAGSDYAWISSTRFSTPYGNMKGHFTMKHLRTGRTLDVICPVFHMHSPNFVTSEERSQRRLEEDDT